jgi:hypothetical protein
MSVMDAYSSAMSLSSSHRHERAIHHRTSNLCHTKALFFGCLFRGMECGLFAITCFFVSAWFGNVNEFIGKNTIGFSE